MWWPSWNGRRCLCAIPCGRVQVDHVVGSLVVVVEEDRSLAVGGSHGDSQMCDQEARLEMKREVSEGCEGQNVWARRMNWKEKRKKKKKKQVDGDC